MDPTLWPLDMHQRIAYQLCYLYWNWFGPIGAPTSCKFAQLIARLSAEWLNRAGMSDMDAPAMDVHEMIKRIPSIYAL